jgi:hypothetical protein
MNDSGFTPTERFCFLPMLKLMSFVVVNSRTHILLRISTGCCLRKRLLMTCKYQQLCRQLHVSETQKTRAWKQCHVLRGKFLNPTLLENKYYTSAFHYRSCQYAVRDSKLAILFTKLLSVRDKFNVLTSFNSICVCYGVFYGSEGLYVIDFNTNDLRGARPSGLWRRAHLYQVANVLEELAASVLSVEIRRPESNSYHREELKSCTLL